VIMGDNMSDTVSFGYWVRRQRKALDLTQHTLARRVGCALVTIRKIESDSRRPSRQMAERLAEQLAIPPDERVLFMQCASGERSPLHLALPKLPFAAPGSTMQQWRTNLPAQVTVLVGRESEVAAVCALLRCTDIRLVTLTGPGGVGKTRLGLQVATDLASEFVDGVYFVSLAPIREPDLVPSAIAQVLGIREVASRPLLETLKLALRARQMLLVLDNYEHVLMAASLVAELLVTCPGLKLLVTSRECLHVRGEHEYTVPPLAVPANIAANSDTLLACTSVELFRQRAVAARRDFVLNNSNTQDVAAICVRLDGLPLALELAAARTKLFSPGALLERLTNSRHHSRLHFLKANTADAPARHHSLWNTVAWSYTLLTQAEQTLFRRLAVFVGGFTLDAVEAVCRAGEEAMLDALDGVASLADKSLLCSGHQTNGEPRFTLLETMREFGLAWLQECGELWTVQRRHAEYYLALFETEIHHMRWLPVDRVDVEYSNLRTALHWAIMQGELDIGLRLGATLHHYWLRRGHHREGLKQLETLIKLAADAPPTPVLATVFYGAGMMSLTIGDSATQAGYFEQAIEVSRRTGDRYILMFALALLGHVLYRQGDFTRANMLMNESMQLAHEVGDTWHFALAQSHSGNHLSMLGNFWEGQRLAERGLAMLRTIGDKWALRISLGCLGNIAYLQGHLVEAKALSMEALDLSRADNDEQHTMAASHSLGLILLAEGDKTTATTFLRRSLEFYHEHGDRYRVANALEAFAWLAGKCEMPARSLLLAGAAAAIRTALGHVLPPVLQERFDQLCAAACSALDTQAAATAWAAGEAMALDEAVAYVLAQDIKEPAE
jgi:predicted ATPase/transcriptional regulator with XRE-family HTH domain